MLSGRMPSWLSASSQILVTDALVSPGGVAVGDVVIIINSCCITRYGKLAYRVGNFPTICIFRQIGEAVGPVIVSCYGLGVCNYAICKKVDGDALWTFAILVVGIVPGFGSGDVEGLLVYECW